MSQQRTLLDGNTGQKFSSLELEVGSAQNVVFAAATKGYVDAAPAVVIESGNSEATAQLALAANPYPAGQTALVQGQVEMGVPLGAFYFTVAVQVSYDGGGLWSDVGDVVNCQAAADSNWITTVVPIQRLIDLNENAQPVLARLNVSNGGALGQDVTLNTASLTFVI